MKASTYLLAIVPLGLFVFGFVYALHGAHDDGRPGIKLSEWIMMAGVAASGYGLILGLRSIAEARKARQGILGPIIATFLVAIPFLSMFALIMFEITFAIVR